MNRPYRSHLFAVGILALVAVMFGPSLFQSPVAAQTATPLAATRTATLVVENMTCALCPVTVRKSMESVSGVKSVKVNFEAKTATVVFDPSVTTVEAIAAASRNAGYPATRT